ncbi:hypothetical protein AAI421_17940 [Rhodococcus aetherivorans]|uniref:DUF7171 family protein n=1 Tax=Rhodococcus aetherivorans TaxID=191292 RepID=UPI0031D1EF51
MSSPKPLIEAARVRFSGLSTESYEEPEIGEQRVYTVLATCTAITEQDMKSEGTRRTSTMKIDKVSEGIDSSIDAGAEADPDLFSIGSVDGPTAAGSEPERIGDVISGISFEGGPTFSGGN